MTTSKIKDKHKIEAFVLGDIKIMLHDIKLTDSIKKDLELMMLSMYRMGLRDGIRYSQGEMK